MMDYDGDEFDYFDENPDEDPFMPKATCHKCAGTGMYQAQDGANYPCFACDGTGVER